MEDEIIERTVQLSRRSFILTIPQAIAREAGIRKGQGVRFRVRDGEIVLSPTDVAGGGDCDGAADPAGPDKYERAIEEMMAKNKSERSGGRGTSSKRSKLERLRIK